ncbi:MAG: homoserine dehydrogenase [Chloroflexota bacterium]|nr:homoserine dehydrogenase [Chloroflexota bacterium]MDE2931029.1 homoserine dehydrogenase [Chloroflexota bacterium]
MSDEKTINIGLMGLGVVGSGVLRIIREKARVLAMETDRHLRVKKILVRDREKTRGVDVEPALLTCDPSDILDDPSIHIVIELIGGVEPAYTYAKRAILAGKHLVTGNKDVMANHGPELLRLANEQNVDVYFEASVGGGIPLIGSFRSDLVANEIHEIYAIINGTTNYILTRMSREGAALADVLAEAQRLGFAEADPTKDVEGIDAAYKLAILTSLAFRTQVDPTTIYHEGIMQLEPADFRYAQDLGYVIKLLALARQDNSRYEAAVHPALVPQSAPLASVDGVYNAVYVVGDLVGNVMFYGRGAGSEPTASAIVADVIDVAHNIISGVTNRIPYSIDACKSLKPLDEIETRFYFRLWAADRPGVLAKIATVCGTHSISIASVIQKEADPVNKTAELVFTTHHAYERAMRVAVQDIAALDVVTRVAGFLRIVDVGESA